MRFSELRRAIPHQSVKVLAATLRDLDNLGLLNKTMTREKAATAVYRLTSKGTRIEADVEAGLKLGACALANTTSAFAVPAFAHS